jgi:hypothetical protein
MMIRMQVQLTETQVESLKQRAASTGRSQADLVREGVDLLLRSENEAPREQRRARALQAIGRFASGRKDVSREHDRHLAEAFRK